MKKPDFAQVPEYLKRIKEQINEEYEQICMLHQKEEEEKKRMEEEAKKPSQKSKKPQKNTQNANKKNSFDLADAFDNEDEDANKNS